MKTQVTRKIRRNKKLSRNLLIGLLPIAGLGSLSFGADTTFTSGGTPNDSWNVAGNWNSGAGPIPDSTSSVIISSGATANQVLDAAFTIKSIYYSTGAVGTLQTNGTGSTARALTLNGDGNGTLISVTGNSSFSILSGNGTLSVVLGNSGNFTVDAGSTLDITSVISQASGSKSVTKNGNGTLILRGTNTFSGGFVLNSGTVGFAATAGLGASGGAVTLNGGMLYNAAVGLLTPSNAINITGDTIFGGTGFTAFTLSGLTTTTGNRILTLNATTTTFTNPGNILGGDLTLNGTGAGTFSGGLGLNGAARTITGNMTGALILGQSSTAALTGTGNVTLMANSAAAITVSGNVTATGLFTNAGTGTGTTTVTLSITNNSLGVVQNSATSALVLTGNSTYTAATSIQAGNLTISGAATFLNTGNISLSSGGRLIVNAADANLSKLVSGGGVVAGSFLKYSAAQTSAATAGPGAIFGTVEVGASVIPNYILDLRGGSTLTNTVSATYGNSTFGAIKLNGNTTFTAGATTFTVGGSVTGNGTYTLALNGTGATGNLTNTINQAAGTLSVVKSGNGTWNLASGVNNYTGPTQIDGGILQVFALADGGLASSIGNGTGSASDLVFGGGTLQFINSTNAAASTNRLFTLGDASGNNGTLDDSAGNNSVGLTFSNTADITFGTGGAHVLGFAGTNTTGGTLAARIIDQGAGNLTSVVKSGAGTWTLTGNNTYTGGTTISGGILKSTVSEGFGTGLITITSGQAYAAATTYSNNWNIAGAIRLETTTLSGNITLSGNSTIVAGAGSGTALLSGKITGSGGLTFQGSAAVNTTWQLSNIGNDYAGDTSMTVSTTSGHTYILSLLADEVIPNGAGKGNLFLDATSEQGTLFVQLNGHSETINGLSSGGLFKASGNLFHDIRNANASAGNLTVGDNNTSATYIGLIENGTGGGVLNLTKKGSGTQTLSGSSTYTGATNITGGTLKIDYTIYGTTQTSAPTNYFTTGSDVTMGNGTTFAIQGRGDGGNITQTGVVLGSATHAIVLPNAVASQLVVGQLLTLTITTGTPGATVPSTFITAIDTPGATTTTVYGSGRLVSNGNTSTDTITSTATNGTTSQTVKSLTLSGLSGENATIDFGTSGDVVLTFGSVAQVTDGSTLTIANWSGIADTGNGTERLMVTGNDTVRLAFLSTFTPGTELVFTGFAGYDAVENTGGTAFEVFATTTVPEPTSLSVLLLGGAFMLKRRRRSKASIEVGIPTA